MDDKAITEKIYLCGQEHAIVLVLNMLNKETFSPQLGKIFDKISNMPLDKFYK